jgi:hypothetical protein
MRSTAVALVMAAASLAHRADAQDMRVTSASRQRGNEADLSVGVSFGAGRFLLRPGPEGILYRARLRYDAEVFEPVIRYDAASRHVRLGIEGLRGRGRGWDRDNLPEQRLEVELSPAVPTDLVLEFGGGTADVNLGGLSVRRAHLKAGAAETTVRFDQPNRVRCDELSFEVGAIALSAEHLGNARCRRIGLKGGAADITLDLTGAWPESFEADVEMAVGVGSVTLVLPEGLGVAVEMDRFLASFDQAGLRRRGDRYYSAAYETASTKLHINAKTVVGNVAVRWVAANR